MNISLSLYIYIYIHLFIHPYLHTRIQLCIYPYIYILNLLCKAIYIYIYRERQSERSNCQLYICILYNLINTKNKDLNKTHAYKCIALNL